MNEIHTIIDFLNHPEALFLHGFFPNTDFSTVLQHIREQQPSVPLIEALPVIPADTQARLEAQEASKILTAQYPQETAAVLSLFSQCTPGISASMKENLMTKLAFWMQRTICPSSFSAFSGKALIYCGTVKKHEFLFCYFLHLLKRRVLILSEQPALSLDERLTSYITDVPLREVTRRRIPTVTTAGCATQAPAATRPDRPAVQPQRVTRPVQPAVQPQRTPLDFEALARLASSVVMIQIEDETGRAVGSGSGIMVGQNGYILTNFHVVSHGKYYAIRIEDDPQIYRTDELIKYNQFLDLALLRIDRRLTPLPIYDGRETLVRGQKVIAIGSPMGLFNTVSDGIISGFRRIEDADMIQFTAPISSGSSGGAVLNMYGEIIGISTSGFDAGQNLNLAMPYDCIYSFVRGFLT